MNGRVDIQAGETARPVFRGVAQFGLMLLVGAGGLLLAALLMMQVAYG